MSRDDLTRALSQLDDQVDVPAALDARVMARVMSPRGRPRWGSLGLSAVGGALATAAVAGLLFLGQPGPGEYRLVEGVETVRGEHVMLMAGGVRVEVDGEARITVEPNGPLTRREGPEVNMGTSHWLAAAGGAAVTVAVIAGAALVWPEGGAGPLTLSAGESWSSEEAGGPMGDPIAIRMSPDSAAGKAVLSGDLEGATQAALAEEVKRLRMESQLLRGQLEKYQGSPEPWPEKIAADLRPEAFEATIDGVLDDYPEAELIRIDCEEYPCLAVVRAMPGTEDASLALKGFAEAMGDVVKADHGDDEVERGVMMAIAERHSDDGPPESVGVVGVLDGDGPDDPDRQARLHQRMKELEQDESGGE